MNIIIHDVISNPKCLCDYQTSVVEEHFPPIVAPPPPRENLLYSSPPPNSKFSPSRFS